MKIDINKYYFIIHFVFRETVKSELKAANQQQALGIAILLLVLIISPIIIFLVRNATATIHIFSLTLSTKEQVSVSRAWSDYEMIF